MNIIEEQYFASFESNGAVTVRFSQVPPKLMSNDLKFKEDIYSCDV